MQDLGDARHADAADADEMNKADIQRHGSHAMAPEGESLLAITSC